MNFLFCIYNYYSFVEYESSEIINSLQNITTLHSDVHLLLLIYLLPFSVCESFTKSVKLWVVFFVASSKSLLKRIYSVFVSIYFLIICLKFIRREFLRTIIRLLCTYSLKYNDFYLWKPFSYLFCNYNIVSYLTLRLNDLCEFHSLFKIQMPSTPRKNNMFFFT